MVVARPDLYMDSLGSHLLQLRQPEVRSEVREFEASSGRDRSHLKQNWLLVRGFSASTFICRQFEWFVPGWDW